MIKVKALPQFKWLATLGFALNALLLTGVSMIASADEASAMFIESRETTWCHSWGCIEGCGPNSGACDDE